MNIELFCKALSVIYSKRFGMKVTVSATRIPETEPVEEVVEHE